MATKTDTTICAGCGRPLAETGTKRLPAGRRYGKHGWHNATAKACAWCGTWVRWDEPIPQTIDEVRRYATSHGSHFFDPASMRFFGSRVADGVRVVGPRAYFITSEQDIYGGQPRLYTLRALTAGGDVVTVDKFQQYPSLRAARAAMREVKP